MEKITLVLMAVAVALVLLAGVQAIQLSELKGGAGTGAATTTATSNGQIDMAGWTANEKMMYEHHGTLPARLQQSASAPKPASSSDMVGGC